VQKLFSYLALITVRKKISSLVQNFFVSYFGQTYLNPSLFQKPNRNQTKIKKIYSAHPYKLLCDVGKHSMLKKISTFTFDPPKIFSVNWVSAEHSQA